MEWFNWFGLIFLGVIMIPNVIFAIRCKEGFENKWQNKGIMLLEQVGRFGCFAFMIFQVPGTWFGWWSDGAFAVYLLVDSLLAVLYCVTWIVCWKKNSLFRALALSSSPAALFLFSAVMSRSLLLFISAVVFAPTHILISCKNAK